MQEARQRFLMQNRHVYGLNTETVDLSKVFLEDKNFVNSLNLTMFQKRRQGERFQTMVRASIQSQGKLQTPDLLVVLNPKENYAAIDEARIHNIPVIALVDSNVSINRIDYPIPGNDDN